jgi:ribosomal protein S18 acetylase RimI-like enzyme
MPKVKIKETAITTSPSKKRIFSRYFHVFKGDEDIGYIQYDKEAKLNLESYNEKVVDVKDGGIAVLWVDKKYRGKGIGSKLIEKAERYARKDGRKRLILQVMDKNKKAQKLYNSYGFEFSKAANERQAYRIGKYKYKMMVKELREERKK